MTKGLKMLENVEKYEKCWKISKNVGFWKFCQNVEMLKNVGLKFKFFLMISMVSFIGNLI